MRSPALTGNVYNGLRGDRGNIRRPDEALAIWGILAKKLPLLGRRQRPERILALLSMTLPNNNMFIFHILQ
jgi:hypothetical protein